MIVLIRAVFCVGIFTFGFYLGREIGRLESIREELRQARAARRRNGVDTFHGEPGVASRAD